MPSVGPAKVGATSVADMVTVVTPPVSPVTFFITFGKNDFSLYVFA